jgi:hypothetical protein
LVIRGKYVCGLYTLSVGRPADKFELSKVIPAEAFMVVHARSHDGQAFIKEQYTRVWAALEKARLDRVLKSTMRKMATADGTTTREEFEDQWLEINDLIAGVEWSQLMAREMAIASKIGMPGDFVMLCRPAEGTLDKSYEGLSAILKRLTELTPELSVNEVDDQGVQSCQIVLPAPFPFAVTLAKHKDMLLFGMGSSMIEQTIGLMTGEVEGTLAETERFEKAFAGLPAGEDELFFMDMERMFVQIRQVIAMAESSAEPPAEGAPNPVDVVKAVIDEFDIFDTIAATGTTKGMHKRSETIALLRPDTEKKLLYTALFSNPPLEKPFMNIPVEAAGVNVNSGISLSKLYDGVLNFVEREVPDGAAQLEMFKQEMANAGFDPHADLLDWLQGGFSSFTVPGPTQFAQSNWALLLTVDDAKQATLKINDLMTFVGQQLGEQGQVTTVEIGETTFHSVVQPMLAMMGLTPVVGVKDKHLMIGSSTSTIEMSLAATEADKTFAANERYKKEGLPLGKNVVSFRFEDTTQFGEQLAQGLQMVQMVSMFGGPEINQNPVLSTLIRVAGKVAPVARELNFYQSTCAQTTFDGKSLHTTMLVNYREPPKPKVEEEDAAEEGDSEA